MTGEHDEWKGVPYRPNPDCTACKGAGFLHPVIEGEVDYAKIVPCRESGCLQESVRRSVKGDAAVQTFDNFRPVRGTEEALRHAKALACGEAKFIWLLMYGRPGNGKTHLCNAIVREVRARGLDVRMVLAADLFSLLREAIRNSQTDQLLRKFKEVFFLAIDDYGVEYGTEWETAKFDELMTSRFATAKPTVVITNRDISELSERLRSRFTDGLMARVAHNGAPDYRMSKQ